MAGRIDRQITKRLMVAAGLCVALGASAVTAFAAIPNSTSNVIDACYTKNQGPGASSSQGALRVIDTQAGQNCRSNETALQWNQQGAAGVPGPQGQPGPQGATGPTGPAGPVLGNFLSASNFPVGYPPDPRFTQFTVPAGGHFPFTPTVHHDIVYNAASDNAFLVVTPGTYRVSYSVDSCLNCIFSISHLGLTVQDAAVPGAPEVLVRESQTLNAAIVGSDPDSVITTQGREVLLHLDSDLVRLKNLGGTREFTDASIVIQRIA